MTGDTEILTGKRQMVSDGGIKSTESFLKFVLGNQYPKASTFVINAIILNALIPNIYT